MATLPYFVLSPSTILSLLGLLRGPDHTKPTPAEDWRDAKVDVIIPALNEADNIALCLASVMRQTMRPRNIFLIDDGSSDRTVDRALAFCAHHGVALTAIRRRTPIGKTPTIKRQSRELDSDVEFILDADTVLQSEDYIARTVESLYEAVGIASAFGTVLPQRLSDRREAEEWPEMRAFAAAHRAHATTRQRTRLENIARGVTNAYRDVLYVYLQRFIYRGQLAFFGTTSNPVGCAVAYRRKYVKSLFDYISPILGDDLTNSEDIFIGLAMLNEGYRNIQLTDICARTVEPLVHAASPPGLPMVVSVPAVVLLLRPAAPKPFQGVQAAWPLRPMTGSTGWLPRRSGSDRRPSLPSGLPMLAMAAAGTAMESTNPLRRIAAPLALQVTDRPTGSAARGAAGLSANDIERGGDRRMIGEPYRQAFGRARTEAFGRPAGWILLMSAVEKIFFPTALLIMLILGMWEALIVTVSVETATCLVAVWLVTKGERLKYFLKGLAITPLRYALVAFDLITVGRFATDVWMTNDRKWRK